jgi:hypothetical protein
MRTSLTPIGVYQPQPLAFSRLRSLDNIDTLIMGTAYCNFYPFFAVTLIV